MRLLNMPDDLGDEAREAINIRLRGGHWRCKNDTALLTRRVTRAGAVTVTMQCTTCGYSVGGPLKREHHQAYNDYPEWDEELASSFSEAEREDALNRLAALQEEREQLLRARVANKEEFYQSKAWRWMRARVMERAQFKCEACCHRDAETVHHTTYRYGLRAPLYTLRALCNPCHRRMHTQNDEWHDPDLPAHYIYGDDE